MNQKRTLTKLICSLSGSVLLVMMTGCAMTNLSMTRDNPARVKSPADLLSGKQVNQEATENAGSQQRERLEVQPASYQQPAPRVYRSPPPLLNESKNSGQGSGSRDDMVYHHPTPIPPDNYGSLPSTQFSDVDSDLAGYRFQDAGRPPESAPLSRELAEPFSDRVRDVNIHRLYESPDDLGASPGATLQHRQVSHGPVSDRGYLRSGSGLQGHRLNPTPKTATERALELLEENRRLSETLTRTQQQLERRNKELTDERITNQRVIIEAADQLAKSQQEVNRRILEVEKLKARLKFAQKENDSIRRESEATLREIESTLDAVLIKSISR